MRRDKLLDGFRAAAVLGVIFGHAVDYRFGYVPWLHFPQRFASSASDLGVQLFFVISGYIITSLLLREEERGSINVPAFYARRAFRIIPPFAVMLLLASADAASKAKAALFACNLTECSWGVAHAWSLAVEEQFYLAWPALLILLRGNRTSFLVASIGALLATYATMPHVFHSNALSFACIATGALLAVQPTWRPRGAYAAWLAAAAVLLVGPLFADVGILVPFLAAYLLFGARDLPVVSWVLESPPLQWIGAASYSLYLWQQAFLGRDGAPLYLFPVAVLASVYLIEKPFNRVGHMLSTRIKSGGVHGATA